MSPEPILIGWQGTQVRVRHDDPRLTPYSPGVSRLRSAFELASDVDGLRLVLASTMGDRYCIRVRDDGAVVGLWRRYPMAGRTSVAKRSSVSSSWGAGER